jgi:hypothetical protein
MKRASELCGCKKGNDKGETKMRLSIASITLIAVMMTVAVFEVGCESKTARHRNVELRWQKTLEQARLDCAQYCFDKGQYIKAMAILEPMIVAQNNPDTQAILDKIEQQQIDYVSTIKAVEGD